MSRGLTSFFTPPWDNLTLASDFLNPLSTKLDAAQVVRRSYDEAENRIRVDAEVTATIGAVDVVIDASTGDNIAIADPTGTNYLEPNPDGSINVVVTDSGLVNKNIFNEVSGIPSGITTVITNYTALATTKLVSCNFAGTNIAMYSLYIASALSAKQYTFFGNLNGAFIFPTGLGIISGDLISIEVVHSRPDMGDFSCNIIVAE